MESTSFLQSHYCLKWCEPCKCRPGCGIPAVSDFYFFNASGICNPSLLQEKCMSLLTNVISLWFSCEAYIKIRVAVLCSSRLCLYFSIFTSSTNEFIVLKLFRISPGNQILRFWRIIIDEMVNWFQIIYAVTVLHFHAN